MECEGCGTELEFGDKFCSKCGAITEHGKSGMQVLGENLRESGEVLGGLFRDCMDYARQDENRGKVAIGIGAVLLLLVVLTDNPISSTVTSAFETEPNPPQLTADGAPDLASYEDNFLSEEAEYLVTGIANVRNFPTSQGTIVVQTFEGGEVVHARKVRSFDPTSHWYKLGDGRYIWGENLTPVGSARQAGRPQFPTNLRGTWSSMDHCRGRDPDYVITIAEDHIQFYESHGELSAITYDDDGNPQYHLTMRGEGQSWTVTYLIMLTANGMSITFETAGEVDPIRLAYHHPDAGCGRVFFLH